jgi:hypothetical protein
MPVAVHWCDPFYHGSTVFVGQKLPSPNGLAHGTWLSDILPYVEQSAAYTQLAAIYNTGPGTTGTGESTAQAIGVIPTYICPADPTGTTMGQALNVNPYGFGATTYYGNAMVMRINNSPVSLVNSMPDGTSNCVMIAERYMNCGDGSASLSDPCIGDTCFPSYSAWSVTTAFPDGDPLDSPVYGHPYAKSLGVAGGLWVNPNLPTAGARLPGSWSNNGVRALAQDRFLSNRDQQLKAAL